MNLKQIDLRDEGLQYVASCLRGWPGLCSRLAAQLERHGEVFAPVPAKTSRERALQFETGGLMSWRETGAWFEREIEQLRCPADNCSLVFQDLVAGPQDPVLRKKEHVFFDQSDAVYYILGPQELNADTISRTMLQISSFLLVAVFCNVSFSAADVPTTCILGESIVDEFANNAQEVFISAYDREGLVVWRKGSI